MSTFERRLKVGEIDAFTLDVSSWVDGESITSLVVNDDSGGLISVGASSIDGSNLSVLLTGVSIGRASVHFDYTTATRSNCYKATVIVVAGC